VDAGVPYRPRLAADLQTLGSDQYRLGAESNSCRTNTDDLFHGEHVSPSVPQARGHPAGEKLRVAFDVGDQIEYTFDVVPEDALGTVAAHWRRVGGKSDAQAARFPGGPILKLP
jgi:hypothetical protein